jgi:isopentenyl phosphate kinase
VVEGVAGGKVLTPKSYAEMIKPAILNDGTRLRYSMGPIVGKDANGSRFIGHGGGGFGFSSVTRVAIAPAAVSMAHTARVTTRNRKSPPL